MRPVEICKDVHWVGAVDWECRNFHGYMLITAVILFLIHLATPHPEFLQGARLVPVLERVSGRLVRFIPPDINEKLRAFGRKVPAVTITPVNEKKSASAPAKTEQHPGEKPRPEADKPAAEKATPAKENKKGASAKPSATRTESKNDAADTPPAAKKHVD